ncbi:hypothetical protein QFZ74_003222 [Streptomyces sp. V3I7]|nr:hypothetical protein [Streptomyces sp. V3I7]
MVQHMAFVAIYDANVLYRTCEGDGKQGLAM